MPTRRPQAARCDDNHATSGVLPVPPTVRLPTTTTGTPTFTRCRRPTRYSRLRTAMTKPYRNESGASHRGRSRLFHIRSTRERMRVGASIAELGAFEAGVGAFARRKLVVRATLDDAAVLHDDDFVGMFHSRQPMRDDQRGASAFELDQ